MAVSCAAIGMPLLDLFGRNPTVFLNAELTRPEIAVFALVVVLLPGLLASLIELITWALYQQVLDWVHAGLVGFFSAVFGLVLACRLAPDLWAVAFLLALALAIGVPWLERNVRVAATGLR